MTNQYRSYNPDQFNFDGRDDDVQVGAAQHRLIANRSLGNSNAAPVLTPDAHNPTPATTLDPHAFAAWDPNKVYWGQYMDNDHHVLHPGGADMVEYQGAVWVANYYNVDYDPAAYPSQWSGGPWSLAAGSPDVVYTQVAPEAPTGLAEGYTSDSEIALFWKPAQVLGVGHVTSYDVFANGIKIGQTSSTSFAVHGLDASKAYTFSVDAVDTVGNSVQSTALVAHTESQTIAGSQYFSPYVDMTLPTTDLVQLSQASGLRDFTLAFTQSAGLDSNGHLPAGATPTASWGGLNATTLPTGAIIDEVHQVEAEGGTVTISFGGYTGRDPAVTAVEYAANLHTAGHSVDEANSMAVTNLTAEYQSVIDTYGVHSLDFDIENDYYNNIGHDVVGDAAANHMRDLAINQLKLVNPSLHVSYTVATNPNGLSQNYLDMLTMAKTDHVAIDVVNIMTMDYFDGVAGDMADKAIAAANAVHAQLQALGIDAKVGITPMIGQNDDLTEVFTLADATKLETFAHANASWVAGIGMWELPRDSAHNTDTTGTTPTSTDSSLIQSAFEFSSIFSKVSILAGPGNDTVTGDATANTLSGLDGNDRLSGLGGADKLDGGLGKDIIAGGGGADSFIFDTKLGPKNVDTIRDFTHNVDHIQLDNAIFAKVGGDGALDPSFFVANASGTATTAHQYIIYNTTTGALSYDVDGNGTAHTAIQFATLTHLPTLDAGDFLVS